MDKFSILLNEFLPMVTNWIRSTISEEVERALEADRQKQKPSKQYTRDEVCKMLNISKPTLWTKTKSGELRATHIGRRVLYDEAEINRFLGKH